MPYPVEILRPFIEGLNTDSPDYDVRPRQSVEARDLIAPRNLATQRRGWSYDGTVADASPNLVGLWRAQFVLADVTRTITSEYGGDIFIHNPSSAGTLLSSFLSGTCLPRAMYNDELIFCFQDGEQEIQRYSGVAFDSSSAVTTTTFTAGQSIVTATSGTWPSTVLSGSYIGVTAASPSPGNDGVGPIIWCRVLERVSSTVLSLEGIRTVASGTMALTSPARGVAYAYPCVSVYSAGTVSQTSDYTVTGGQFTSGSWGSVTTRDAIYLPVAGTTNDKMQLQIDTVSSNTNISTIYTDNTISNQSYDISRRCPFKDVAVHRGSLWGTGVLQYPNRVYAGPPGWKLGLPPGASEPFDTSANLHSPTRNDFFLAYTEVPTPYDGDVVVALLTTSNPLLVLKRSGVYGIYGVYPTFQTELIQEGAGCFDIRSAWSLPSGPFWAGEEGIFTFRNGKVIDITNGRINREWRTQFGRPISQDGVGTVTIGESYNHLLVTATTDNLDFTTFVFDMNHGTWISRFTNTKSNWYFTSKLPGETERLLYTSQLDGRVRDAANMFDVDTVGNERDGDGTKPRMYARTGSNLSQRSLNEETRMLDLAVTANVYDGGASGSTSMDVNVVAGGGLVNNADETISVGPVDSDSIDRVDRTYFRNVNAAGRYHSVEVDVSTFDTDDSASGAEVQVAEISMNFLTTADRT